MRLLRAEEYLRLAAPAGGPVAILLCEDDHLADESAQWLLARGFAEVIACGPGARSLSDDAGGDRIRRVQADVHTGGERARLVNRLTQAHAGGWVLVCFNGEFFFYPFAETRSVADLAEFMDSERRGALMTYAIDLYSEDLRRDAANAARGEPSPPLDVREFCFDREGWYGFAKGDKIVEVFGGLGWRFEEHTPRDFLRVNRPAFFKAGGEITLDADLWFPDPVLNSISCPWHHNPTGALMSTRRTRTLLRNPTFPRADATLSWAHSTRFEWRSDQLIEAGMIEAGQWF